MEVTLVWEYTVQSSYMVPSVIKIEGRKNSNKMNGGIVGKGYKRQYLILISLIEINTYRECVPGSFVESLC